jgi:hypothetical protein
LSRAVLGRFWVPIESIQADCVFANGLLDFAYDDLSSILADLRSAYEDLNPASEYPGPSYEDL